MRPVVASVLAGLLTFFASYFLLGGARHGGQETHPEVPVINNANNDGSLQPKGHAVTPDPPEGDADAEKVERLRIKLRPKPIQVDDGLLVKHQFLHLHHMKTAGTSMDGLLDCAMKRLQRMGYRLHYANVHECSPRHYRECLSGKDANCQRRIKDAALMSYCAPLKDLPVFEWQRTEEYPVHALTVLRNPVDRVWSMYRFQTKRCYKCKTLKQVYEDYDKAGTYETDMCASQLMNHQTRNLLTKVEGTDEEKVAQAIDDMENFFTFIGLTEEIPATAAIAGKVFPWLAEHMNGTSTSCSFPHRNSSPKNNHCGQGNTHWNLPDHPDEETAELIRQHNQLDIQVYEAAVKHFALQKKALGL